MWRHNWRLDFSVVRFATQAASSRCPILNDSSIIQDGNCSRHGVLVSPATGGNAAAESLAPSDLMPY